MGDVFFWLWLSFAIISIIVEIATNELRSFWYTIGSLSALIVNLINKDLYVLQVFVFIIVSVFSVLYLRPIAQKRMLDTSIGLDSLVGQTVIVVSNIDETHKGIVKFENLYFKGKSLGDSFKKGDKAKIVDIKKRDLIIKKDSTHNI